jgi:ribosomal protein S18 acetylase RimI-like enzyme
LRPAQRVRALSLAPIRVRRIGADEGDLLRETRIRSLADSPEAFGGRLEEAQQQPESEWRAAARASSSGDRRAWFLAERTADGDPEVVGIVQARRRPPASCLLFSMWVAPNARRQGVGRQLVDAVSSWAAGWGGREIVLWVFESNEGAIRLYENVGFEHIRSGPDAEAGRRWSAIGMRRTLDVSRTGTERRSGSKRTR